MSKRFLLNMVSLRIHDRDRLRPACHTDDITYLRYAEADELANLLAVGYARCLHCIPRRRKTKKVHDIPRFRQLRPERRNKMKIILAAITAILTDPRVKVAAIGLLTALVAAIAAYCGVSQ